MRLIEEENERIKQEEYLKITKEVLGKALLTQTIKKVEPEIIPEDVIQQNIELLGDLTIKGLKDEVTIDHLKEGELYIFVQEESLVGDQQFFIEKEVEKFVQKGGATQLLSSKIVTKNTCTEFTLNIIRDQNGGSLKCDIAQNLTSQNVSINDGDEIHIFFYDGLVTDSQAPRYRINVKVVNGEIDWKASM